MPRRDRIRRASLILAPLLLLPAGCSLLPARPKEHSSSALLDSGPGSRVTGRQAADVQYSIGRSHEEDGRPDQAEAAYLAAVAKDPRRADAEARLAVLADRKGDGAGSARHFERALRLAPKDPEILCDRGYGLYLRRRWPEAEASLRSALAVAPSHARSHNNLGLVLAAEGEKDAALAEFARAGLDASDARANLGLVLAMEGKLAESREQYALALRDKPGSHAANQGLRVAVAALTGKHGAGRGGAESLAAKGGDGASSRLDPALMRTSATAAPAAQ